jgi:SAM-dependent methyltransferase
MRDPRSIFMLEIRKQEREEGDWARDAYNALYDQQPIRQLDSFYVWLLDLLHPGAGCRLLDVSCGVGVLTEFARRRGVRAHGLDVSWSAIRQAARESSATYVLGDGERLPYREGTFDYVTNIGSLEHFYHMDAGVREMARVLRPQGRAMILLPNTYSLFGNILTAVKRGVTLDDGQPIQRYAALNEWRQLLEGNGLRVTHVVKYERERPRFWRDIRWYVAHPKPLLRLLVTPFIPLTLAWCFVYICEPDR